MVGEASLLTVVKLDSTGRPVARYPGIRQPAAPGWIAITARWQLGRIASGPLVFEPGDLLVEYFSFVEPINAFALHATDGSFKGWYANVSCPALLVERELWWRDLFIDIVIDALGRITVLDEEELEQSGLRETDPESYACILMARDRLLAAARERAYPFDQHPCSGSRQ